MNWKDCKILRIVKENFDELWHVWYQVGCEERCDRITKEEALAIDI